MSAPGVVTPALPRGARSITWYLALFSAALLVPALLLIGVLSWRNARAAQARIDREVLDRAQHAAAAFDRVFFADRILLATLATNPSALAGDAVAFRERARLIAPSTRHDLALVLRGRDGRILAHTVRDDAAGRAFPTDVDSLVLATRSTRVSDIVVDPVERRASVAMVAPVIVGDSITALLTLVRPSAHALEVLRGALPREFWAGSWSDRHGIVFARTRDHSAWVGKPITPELRRAIRGEAGTWTGPSHEGTPLLGGYARSRESGWLVAIGVERRVLEAPVHQSLATIGGVGLVLAVLSLTLATRIGQRITAPMLALAADADALGRTGTVAPRRFGVREADAVHDALAQAGRAIAQREEALAALNADLEARVAERTSALVQLQKTESLGQLTGGIAHDFNNLLAVVLGSLSLVRKRLDGDARTTQLVDHAVQAAQRGASLTQRLLAFARRQALEMGPVSIPALIDGMSALLARSLGPGIVLRTEWPPSLPPARGDANQLELALLNLAINARDAMPHGGTLRIAAAVEEVADGTIPGLAPARYVRLEVEDTGVGMAPEVVARATEPFFTTKDVGHGTGLGLPMVHGLAQQCGGTMLITSAPGRGTTITLYLPATASATVAPSPVIVVATPGPHRSHRVLVVDDDALVRANSVAMLEELGHQPSAVASAAEALALLAHDPGFALVLTDHAMPGMTGLDLAARLAQSHPTLRVVLATGYAELPDGAVRPPRLSKPFSLEQLARCIDEQLATAVEIQPAPLEERRVLTTRPGAGQLP